MKSVKTVLTSLALSVVSLSSAFASSEHAATVDTTVTYNSGILVLAFAGFLALVVVVQTIPAFISLYGMIKKAAAATEERRAVEVSARK